MSTCAMCNRETKRSMTYFIGARAVCYTCYREANGEISLDNLDRRVKALEEEVRKMKEGEKK